LTLESKKMDTSKKEKEIKKCDDKRAAPQRLADQKERKKTQIVCPLLQKKRGNGPD